MVVVWSSSNWANLLACRVGTWPFSYLGVTIGASTKSKKFWIPITNKVKTTLSLWRSKTLNKQGRSTLIKSTINSLPLYWMSVFLTPKGE